MKEDKQRRKGDERRREKEFSPSAAGFNNLTNDERKVENTNKNKIENKNKNKPLNSFPFGFDDATVKTSNMTTGLQNTAPKVFVIDTVTYKKINSSIPTDMSDPKKN